MGKYNRFMLGVLLTLVNISLIVFMLSQASGVYAMLVLMGIV